MWTAFTTKNIFKYVFSDLTHFNSNIYEDKILLSDFTRLAFFTLIWWSQENFSPANTKLKLITIGEIQFVATRYGSRAMETVFGAQLIPILGKDHCLNFRLFQFSHQDRNMLHNYADVTRF